MAHNLTLLIKFMVRIIWLIGFRNKVISWIGFRNKVISWDSLFLYWLVFHLLVVLFLLA